MQDVDDSPTRAAFDEAAFDRTIAAANPSMVIVTARAGDELDACLVGFHSQCSIDPLRYAVWLSAANRTTDIARNASALRVHWIAAHRRDLAELAGGQSLDRHPDKMAQLRWRDAGDGTVLLDGANGSIAGPIVHRHDDGDHVCFVIEPFDATPATDPVLRYTDVRHIAPGHDADPSAPPR